MRGLSDMKMTVLHCSPRSVSVSAGLCRAGMKAAADAGCEIKEYRAYDMKASGCLACGFCGKKDGCALRDLDGFIADLETSDLFFISAPVFHDGLPGPAKSVFDRFQRYYSARFERGVKKPGGKPKKALLFLASGHSGERGSKNIADMIRQQFTVMNTKLEAVIICPDTDSKEPGEAAFALAEKAGRDILELL